MDSRRDHIYRAVRDALRASRGDNLVAFPRGRPETPRSPPHNLYWAALVVLLLFPVSFDIDDQCRPELLSTTSPTVTLADPPAACAGPPPIGCLFGFVGCATASR